MTSNLYCSEDVNFRTCSLYINIVGIDALQWFSDSVLSVLGHQVACVAAICYQSVVPASQPGTSFAAND